mmetsp:Transcript_78374/g.205682  ORF Transcript_78374/g.205682 Transcript_78374/m.205682 type:complete len:446 (-) Transcript_78374:189-1526(-)
MPVVHVSLADALFNPLPAKVDVPADAAAPGRVPEPPGPSSLPVSLPLPLSLASQLPRAPASPPPSFPAVVLDPSPECGPPPSELPRKLELPAAALFGSRTPTASKEPAWDFGGMSPPPALPPTVSLCLFSALPPAPPPSAATSPPPPPGLPGSSPRPCSMPPSLPPSLSAEVLLRRDDCSEPPQTEASAPRKVALPAGALAQGPSDEEAAAAVCAGGSRVQFPPGLGPPVGTPSHGSALHAAGNCRPCAWFWKPQGCQNESSCGHCHVCPEGEIRNRKKTKQVVLRLGLATPHAHASPPDEAVRRLSFISPKKGGSAAHFALGSPASDDGDDVSSTTGPPSEQELTGSSEQESDGAPGQDSAAAPSLGSAGHRFGDCQPCAWFWKPVGCQSDAACNYCHLCSEGELRSRKKSKQTALRSATTPQTADATPSKQDATFALSLASLI